jgi:ATP-dependent helicase HrpA
MQFSYPDNLPITACRDQIIATLRQHQVVVVAGETGSGKTTQLAKMCREAFAEDDPLIGCTQPRRIAATTVAARVAEELGGDGAMVGYKIRFLDQTGPATRIKFMTDGVLLAETRQDRLLSAYRVIIVDEAHERSLNIDFLLGHLRQLIDRRPELKLLITSATIDTDSFSRHFNDAPVLTISGRSYPVTLRYQPPPEDADGTPDGIVEHAVATVVDLCQSPGSGDILVFLATERDIRECCDLLGSRNLAAEILPLYGRLPISEQRKIFQPAKRRKIVVATNVAETSVTVPGIRTVVDAGLARISQYNPRAKTTSLPVVRISKAACAQRAGRCGRIGPGLCVRLYSEEDFADRPDYTLPELQRANLAEVILQMTALGLGEPEGFPFLSPPGKPAIREGYRLLQELGAIDQGRKLTARGRLMATLPIDPCIARIILEAKEGHCLREIKIIAAALAIQDPRLFPPGQEKQAIAAQAVFAQRHSDFLVLHNIWQQCHLGEDGPLTWGRLKKFCQAHLLSFQRMREWIDLHEQLERLVSRQEGFEDNREEASYEAVHKALLSGFIRNIAVKKQGKIYQGAQNREVMVFPGSHQFAQSGKWLVAATFLETSRLYALTVATIEPEWIEAVAGHLCSYSWNAPRWQKKTGQVLAEETVSLFGLVLASGRTVDFPGRSRKNIAVAREIFLAAALVGGEISGNYPFLSHNQALLVQWREAEEKLRTRNIVIDEAAIHAWYQARLPAEVCDRRSLNRFLRQAGSDHSLRMSEADILLRLPGDKELLDYPPSLAIGRLTIHLEYLFQPGSENDGITFRLPLDCAEAVPAELFDWLVPGLLEEKIHHLLRSLPKATRKKLVPLNESVQRLLDGMEHRKGSLYAALEAALFKLYRVHVPRSEWTTELPRHLQPRFALTDSDGRELAAGRDLGLLLAAEKKSGQPPPQQLAPAAQALLLRWQGQVCSNWAFHGLPPDIPITTGSGEVAGWLYPMLVPLSEKGAVRVEFTTSRKSAATNNVAGNLYLYCLQFPEQAKAFKKYCSTALAGPASLWLQQLAASQREVVDILRQAVLRTLFGPLPDTVVAEEEFIGLVKAVEGRAACMRRAGRLVRSVWLCCGEGGIWRKR